MSNLPSNSRSLCSYTAAALLDSPSPPKLAMEILFEWEPLRSAEPNLFIILLRPSFSPAGRSGGGCCDILVTALGEVDHAFDHELSFFPFPRSAPVFLTVACRTAYSRLLNNRGNKGPKGKSSKTPRQEKVDPPKSDPVVDY